MAWRRGRIAQDHPGCLVRRHHRHQRRSDHGCCRHWRRITMRYLRIHPQLSPAAPSAAVQRPAPDDSRSSSPFTVRGCDGIQLSGAHLGPESAPATVVYVHGVLTDSSYCSPLTAYLHQRLDGGIAQVVYDQRGHGHSDPTRSGRRITMDALVEDLDAVLATVSGAVVLVAHSVASLVVQAWIATFPHRARGLAGVVLLNGCTKSPTVRESSDGRWAARRVRRQGIEPIEQLRAYLYLAPRAYRREPRTLRMHPRAPGARLTPQYLDSVVDEFAVYAATTLTPEAVSVMRSIPSWVLAGDLDPVVTPSHAQALAERIWSDFENVPGAGHSLPYAAPVRPPSRSWPPSRSPTAPINRTQPMLAAKPLPPHVLSPLTQLLGWLAWFVLLLCIARVVWVGGLLAIRLYREEAVEGLVGALAAAVLLGSASSLALAVLPT
ncbi:alpha/beta hydrolase [Nocardia gamkensis]|uniref:alpha/beta hydrolase n=1 Tax=Nocardia gamkensis TaxID=352869 RepID=UPI0036E84A83